MNKSVWVGSAVGLLFLAVLGVGWWAWQGASRGPAPGAPQTAVVPRASVPALPAGQDAGLPAMQGPGGGSSAGVSGAGAAPATALGGEARRKRLNQIRAEIAAVQAQGAQASPAQVQALLDELQALSPGQFDPRYFQALREMLEGSGQMQALHKELQALSSSKSPADEARKKAILAELQAISARISAAAVDFQTYSRRPGAPVGKTP